MQPPEAAKPTTSPTRVGLQVGETTRREFLKRSAVLGVGVAGISGVLAACGGEDDQATPTVTGAAPTGGGTNMYAPQNNLDKFEWSFAIPTEDSENTAYFVNKEVFGPNEGIDLVMHSGTTTTDFIKLVADHRYNAAHPSVFVMALMKDQGLPVRVYFDNMNINIFGWAVTPDSPIKTPNDLEGKKVAIGVVGWDALWNPIMAAAGADWESVEYNVVGLGPGPRLNALHSGRVDAIVTWNGEFAIFKTESELQGDGTLTFISGEDWLQTPANGFAAAEDRLEPDRDLLVRAARAQAKSMWFVRTNPEEAVKMFHKHYPNIQAAPGQAVEIATEYNETGFTDETSEHGLGWSSTERWQNLLDSMFEFELTREHLQAEDMFTNDFLEEINDFDENEVIEFAKEFSFEEWEAERG